MHNIIKNYQWLIFDADNTLFDYDQAEQLALVKTLEDYDINYCIDSIFDIYNGINHKLWAQLETGEITSQSEIKIKRTIGLFKALNVERNVSQFAEDYLFNLSQNGHLLDNAQLVIKHLAQNHDLMIMTNGMTKVQKPRLNASPLGQYFKHIVISEEIGYAKPSKAIFDHAFELMQQPQKDQVIIVGDSLGSDIQGAINYGIDSIWYNPRKTKQEHNATYEINDLLAFIDQT